MGQRVGRAFVAVFNYITVFKKLFTQPELEKTFVIAESHFLPNPIQRRLNIFIRRLNIFIKPGNSFKQLQFLKDWDCFEFKASGDEGFMSSVKGIPNILV